jgi:hypothetical protein
MKKIFLTTTALFLTLLLSAQAQKGTKPKNHEVKEPILTTIPVESKSTPVIRAEDEIKELIKKFKSLNVDGSNLILQGVTEKGNMMYRDTGGRKIGINPLTGEMEVLASTAKCKFPLRYPNGSPGPYDPYPKEPYFLYGISPEGLLINTSSEGDLVSVNPKTGELSKTFKEPKGGCVLRPQTVKK